ncbi:MAG: protein-glutamate O-methyltransferase CheR [Proteobacteria bacterium]|nr:protein-glutamate O-methyltransferase CheR [Pseudomonadota bacterium]
MDINLENIHDFLFDRANFTLFGLSEVLQETRVRQRMAQLGMTGFGDYWKYLHANGNDELQELINALTVTETYFFRDYDQLANFAEEVLPDRAARKEAAGNRRVRVMCGACASGEEAYTLAIILLEMMGDEPNWDIRIDALDINTAMLDRAGIGCYSSRSIRDLPLRYKIKYFDVVGDKYCVKAEGRAPVRFYRANLTDAAQMRSHRGFDFIFCRNLLLYLDENQRERLIHILYHSLEPGGCLFLGPTESIGRVSKVFRLVKIGRQYVYQKA